MIDISRWKSRFLNYPKYLFWHAVDMLNRDFSLERPRIVGAK